MIKLEDEKMKMRRTYVGYDLGDTETITDVVTLNTGESTSNTVFYNMTMLDTVNPGQAMPTIFAFDETGEIVFSNAISAAPEYVHDITMNFKKRPSTLLLPSKRTEFEQIVLRKMQQSGLITPFGKKETVMKCCTSKKLL